MALIIIGILWLFACGVVGEHRQQKGVSATSDFSAYRCFSHRCSAGGRSNSSGCVDPRAGDRRNRNDDILPFSVRTSTTCTPFKTMGFGLIGLRGIFTDPTVGNSALSCCDNRGRFAYGARRSRMVKSSLMQRFS
jgi:hypothetical protein